MKALELITKSLTFMTRTVFGTGFYWIIYSIEGTTCVETLCSSHLLVI